MPDWKRITKGISFENFPNVRYCHTSLADMGYGWNKDKSRCALCAIEEYHCARSRTNSLCKNGA